MKKYILLAGIVFVSALAMAQSGKIVAEKLGKGAIMIHEVQPKEGLYAIAKIYNVSVNNLASVNKLDQNAGLSIGQKLKIPMNALEQTRFGTGAPVYYVVGAKENLSSISNRFHKMPVKNIMIWNDLKEGENVKKGQEIIVGYLPKGVGSSGQTASKQNEGTDKKNEKYQQATITGSNINIRKGPSTDQDVVGIAQENDVVDIVKKVNNEWTSIRTKDGVEGYIATQFVQPGAKKEAALKTAVITGSNINIRKGPSTDQDVVGIAQENDVVDIVKKVNNEWTSIRTKDGIEGYIATQFVQPGTKKAEAKKEAALKTAVITGSNINIRKGPSTDQDVVGIAQENDVVTILKNVNSEWSSIKLKDGTEGFVVTRFLGSGDKESDRKKTLEVKKAKVYGTNINVRKGPSTDQEVVGIAQQDEVLTYVKKVDNEWSEIRMGDGTNGFIATRFLSIDGKPSLAALEAEKIAQSQAEDARKIAEEAAAREKALAEARKKEEDQKAEALVSEKIIAKNTDEAGATSVVDETGYFKADYEKSVNPNFTSEKIFASGIFKTDRGWNDGKYYVLMDAAAPGTIVKLSNPSNNKIVYAKVLGKMKGVQYSDGFDVRISEAAAKKLQTENTDKFNVAVTY